MRSAGSWCTGHPQTGRIRNSESKIHVNIPVGTSRNHKLDIPCGDDSTYTRSQFSDAVQAAAADTTSADVAGKVERTSAAGQADCDNGLDVAVARSASESLALLPV